MISTQAATTPPTHQSSSSSRGRARTGVSFHATPSPRRLFDTVAATSARDFTRAGEVFWHLNVWSSGRICLNLLNEPDGTWHGQWSPSITIKQILCAIQELLDNPFPAGARPEVQTLYERNRPAYERRLRQEADKYRKRPLPDDDDDVVVIE